MTEEGVNPFYKQIRKKASSEMRYLFGDFIPSRLEDNWDFIGVGSGGEGVGKSTLVNQACLLVDPTFSLEKNVLYNPDAFELRDMIMDFKPKSAINADEAINILYKMDFATKMQKSLSKLYATCRKRRLASFFCLPDFMDLGKFFQRRTHAWFHIIDRGHVVVFLKSKNFVGKDKWGIDYLDKIFKKRFGFKRSVGVSPDQILNICRKSPNYFLDFRFPALPTKFEQRYEKLALEATKEFEIEAEGHAKAEYTTHALARAVKYMCTGEAGMTQMQCSEKIGVSQATVSRLLQRVKARQIDERIRNLTY